MGEREVGRSKNMSAGTTSVRPTSPIRSARHKTGTYVPDTRQTNKRMSVNRYEPIVQPSNGERARAKIFPPPRSLAPLDLRDGRPLGRLKTIVLSLRSLRSSDPAPRRGLALAGVPAPTDAPCSTTTSALHRVRPLYGHDAKGQGRAATARRCGSLASGTDQLVCARGRDC